MANSIEISELSKTASGNSGDMGSAEKAHALGEIVVSREQTNQRLIALYEKMYDDLKLQTLDTKERLVTMLLGELENHALSNSSKKAIHQALQYAMQCPM